MKNSNYLINILSLLVSMHCFADETKVSKNFLPANIYQLDSKFSHHVLLVEKSTHSLYLYAADAEVPKLIKKFKILTGKFTGNKMDQGDKRTPEGVYFFQQFHSSEFLINKFGDYGKIYGAGAFTTNYPNEMDRRAGKTGSGIWLHSTDDDGRVSLGLDSKGCVVAIDQDLKEISQYIDLVHTPVVITQDLAFQEKETWLRNKQNILTAVNTWAEAWKTKDFTSYIESYSQDHFIHRQRGKYDAFKIYKKAVFSRADKPEISFSDISILQNKDYVVVTMEQNYSSPIIKDIGKKTLYLKKNANYDWKIVAEEWSRLDEQRSLAFTPKMRYFSEQTSVNDKDLKHDSKSI